MWETSRELIITCVNDLVGSAGSHKQSDNDNKRNDQPPLPEQTYINDIDCLISLPAGAWSHNVDRTNPSVLAAKKTPAPYSQGWQPPSFVSA
jgi:hypothetical protein